jgi:hypothetical protein
MHFSMRYRTGVRTTLGIDDDRKMTVGQIISQLVRKAIAPKRAPRMRNGVLPFELKPGARKPTMALVNRLRDEQ